MKIPSFVNRTIFLSIPLNSRIKHFVLNYYLKMVSSNGHGFATDQLKLLRQHLCAYRADPKRHEHLSSYVRTIPLSYKGWLRGILKCMDSSPTDTLNLFKLFTRPNAVPVQTIEEIHNLEKKVLAREGFSESLGKGLINSLLRIHRPKSKSEWKLSKDDFAWKRLQESELVKNMLIKRSKQELINWFRKWNPILSELNFNKRLSQDFSILDSAFQYYPVPEIYADYDPEMSTSSTYQKDVWEILSLGYLIRYDGINQYLNRQSPTWINLFGEWLISRGDQGHLSDPLYLKKVIESTEFDKIAEEFEKDTDLLSFSHISGWIMHNFMDSEVKTFDERELPFLIPDVKEPYKFLLNRLSGEIHYIPKKGTVKRRPIAAPNRFFQMVMYPLQRNLGKFLKLLPKDCTFNQSRFDRDIQKRINSSKYISSIDLSQATDNIPFSWFDPISDRLYKRTWDADIRNSWKTFQTIARGRWLANNESLRWKVGQPLGTAPSFNILGITHNLVLESLSLYSGFLRSPYYVLGDDVLVTEKSLRERYLNLCSKDEIPISISKSYQGNLVEFAGKFFIKNQPPLYSSDHVEIKWESLFDYQFATGSKIRFSNLKTKLQRIIKTKVQQIYHSLLTENDKTASLYREAIRYYTPDGYHLIFRLVSSKEVYDFISSYLSSKRKIEGGHRPGANLQLTGLTTERLALFELLLSVSEDDDRVPLSGITGNLEFFHVKSCPTGFRLQANQQDPESSGYPPDYDSIFSGGYDTVSGESRGSSEAIQEGSDASVGQYIQVKLRHSRLGKFRAETSRKEYLDAREKWFMEKYRPYTTDKLFQCGAIAVLLEKSSSIPL